MGRQSKDETYVKQIEERFKEISGLHLDLSVFPLKNNIASQVETSKVKSKDFGEVFTPLWLVDKMIRQCKIKSANKETLDLCAGYGQFSVRLLRHLSNSCPDFSLRSFLTKHSFAEMQISSCYKLLYVFNIGINLFIGDAVQLPKLPKKAKGIWVYLEEPGYWVCLTKTIQNIFYSRNARNPVCSEDDFVERVSSLINHLNEVYKKMNASVSSSLSERDRVAILNRFKFNLKEMYSAANYTYLQDVITPIPLVNGMIAYVNEIEHKSILALYNAEFVEQLIHKYNVKPEKITFAVDIEHKELAEYVRDFYGVEIILLFNSDPKVMRSDLGTKRWDACFSNPPYSRGLDLKILQALMGDGCLETSLAKEYVIVHPANWLLDRKGISRLFVSSKEMLQGKVKSVELFNGYRVFGCKKLSLCSITHIDLSRTNNNIDVMFCGKENFSVKNIFDITRFGSSWKPLVEPFVSRIQQAIQKNGHLWQHNTKTIDPHKHYVQLAAIIGTNCPKNDFGIRDDFFTLTTLDIEICKGIREPRLHKPGGATPTFGQDTIAEGINLLNYLNTDCIRFCLAIYKITQHVENGELAIIPWLDFTQAWDDEKLFKHFGIDQATQDYIRNFLPDYYGIRKQG